MNLNIFLLIDQPATTPSGASPVLTCVDNTGSFAYDGQTEAAVHWTSGYSAIDEEDGSIQGKVVCKSIDGQRIYSRSKFPVGTNATVTCSATDSDGNTGFCSYSVAVLGKTQ